MECTKLLHSHGQHVKHLTLALDATVLPRESSLPSMFGSSVANLSWWEGPLCKQTSNDSNVQNFDELTSHPPFKHPKRRCVEVYPHLAHCPLKSLNLKNWSGKNVTCDTHLLKEFVFLNERPRQPMDDVYHGNSNLVRKQQWSTGPIPFKTANLPFIFGLLSLPFYENCLKKESISPQSNVVKGLVLHSKKSNKLKLHRILRDICGLLGTARP